VCNVQSSQLPLKQSCIRGCKHNHICVMCKVSYGEWKHECGNRHFTLVIASF